MVLHGLRLILIELEQVDIGILVLDGLKFSFLPELGDLVQSNLHLTFLFGLFSNILDGFIMVLDVHVPELAELRGISDGEVLLEEFSDGVPVSVVIDSHVLVSKLNNQLGKGGPAFKILEEIKISISLSDLTFNSGGQ
jgi:hypothetical protein